MRELSVGVLLPSSTIFPIGKQFQKGLKSVFSSAEGVDVELVSEFIGQGDLKQLESAIEKLKSFHDVDLITGWVSNKGLMAASEKVNGNTPYYITNLGEHIPDPSKIPSNVKLNSIDLWQQLWSMGYWAVNSLGKKGMIVGGLYDMGYSFAPMMDLGMLEANNESKWSLAVCPMPEQGAMSDPNIVLDHVEREMPDFLFAAFCGEESTLFLNEFVKRGLHKKIKLLGTPYLLEDFDQDLGESLSIYTTLVSEHDINDNHLQEDWTKPFGAFYELGRETGANIIQQFGGENDQTENTPTYGLEREGKDNRVFIVENTHSGSKEHISRRIIKEEKTIDVSDDKLKHVLSQGDANWLNPYLGI